MAAMKTMTIRQALAAFGVSAPCLHSWRKGTPTKEALPVLIEDGQRGVLISVTAAKAWAKKHNVTFAQDPDAVIAKEPASLKSGPRPSTKAVAKPKVKIPVPPARKRAAAAAA